MRFSNVLDAIGIYAAIPEDPQPRFKRAGWKGWIQYRPAENVIVYWYGACMQYMPDTRDMMAYDWEEVGDGDKEDS